VARRARISAGKSISAMVLQAYAMVGTPMRFPRLGIHLALALSISAAAPNGHRWTR
jgi:hypothetical protein